MPKLILVKHAKPLVDPAIPSDQWHLSDDGRARCAPLAERLRPHAPTRIITSIETKAVETGELLAQLLGIPAQSAENLHEHDRSNVPHLPSRDFISAIAQFFAHPRQLVLGRETADQAQARFDTAIRALLATHPADTLILVTHATVLALFAEYYADVDPFSLWRQMQLPSYLVFQTTGMELVERVDAV